MDGYDLQEYTRLMDKLSEHGLRVEAKGQAIGLYSHKKRYGVFKDVHEVFMFMCGYEDGFCEGKYNKEA